MAGLLVSIVFCLQFLICKGVVSGWGEICDNTHDCNDHRYVCVYDENHKMKKCICDRFHEWRGNITGCLPKYNATTILQMVTGRTSHEEERDEIISSAFIIQWVAGIFVFISGLLASCSVCVYCWHIRKKDKALRLEIQELISRKNSRKVGTSAEV